MPDLTVSGEPAVSWYEEPTMLDHPETTAIGDGFITSRVNTQLRLRLSAAQVRIGIDKVLALDNPFVQLLDQVVDGKEDAAAEFLSDLLLGVLIPDDDEGMRAGPGNRRGMARRMARRRLTRHLVRKEGFTHTDAVAKVESITDEQFDKAINLPATADELDEQTWLQWIVQFFKDNWLTILKVLLMLVMFLNPGEENGDDQDPSG